MRKLTNMFSYQNELAEIQQQSEFLLPVLEVSSTVLILFIDMFFICVLAVPYI